MRDAKTGRVFDDMIHYVALLRGINLGKRRVKMSALGQLFAAQGFENVSTVLASGNVLFSSRLRSEQKLIGAISSHLHQELGYEVPTLVRTAAQLREVIARAPFGDLFSDAPHASTQITFFDQPIDPALVSTIAAMSTQTDRLKVIGRELYWRCATKISESTVWESTQRNPHNIPGSTTRNLQTLEKIAARLPR